MGQRALLLCSLRLSHTCAITTLLGADKHSGTPLLRVNLARGGRGGGATHRWLDTDYAPPLSFGEGTRRGGGAGRGGGGREGGGGGRLGGEAV